MDIEDLVTAEAVEGDPRQRRGLVVPKCVSGEDEAEMETVYVKTWGCSHNNSDGEYMSGLLAEYGYRITQNPTEAQLWLLNSCTVKNPSEQTFLNAVQAAKKADKFVVVAGCVPQGERKHSELQGLSVVGIDQIDRVVEVVEETLRGNAVRLYATKSVQDRDQVLALPKIRKNRFIEILPINQGCLNQCTYCKTKHSRGDLRSYSPTEIVKRVRQVLREGVVEIWISSEDTGAYGRDIGVSLPELLDAILAELPDQGVMLRVGMTNPPYILEHLKAVSVILSDPRVYAFMHVPVQAGSNRVLAAMRREYTRQDFETVVNTLRQQVKGGVSIATDVICGFPGETEADFEETLSLLRKYQFPSVHISQFYARKGTPAARMANSVPSHERKARSRLATIAFNAYETYTERVGERFRVLCTDIAADGNHFVAHNKQYEQVLVPQDETLMGRAFDVTITAATKFCIFGQVIPGTLVPLPVYDRSPSPVRGRGKTPTSTETVFVSPVPKEDINWGQYWLLLVGLFFLLCSIGLKLLGF